MVKGLGKGKFFSGKQRKKVMAIIRGGGDAEEETFKSDEQRKGFFGKVQQVKDSDTRSEHAKAIDDAKQAKKVHPFTEKGIKKWRREPSKSDLKYVDTPRILKELKEIKKKRQTIKKVIKKETEVIKREDRQIKEKVRESRQVVKAHPKRRKTPEFRKMTGVEKLNLYKIADKHGVDRDLVDFEAYIDPTLNYYENRDTLEKHISKISAREEMEDKSEEYDHRFNEYIGELKYRAEITEDPEEKKDIMDQYRALRGLEPVPA